MTMVFKGADLISVEMEGGSGFIIIFLDNWYYRCRQFEVYIVEDN